MNKMKIDFLAKKKDRDLIENKILGDLYASEKYYQLAKNCYELNAKEGDAQVQYLLGKWYYSGMEGRYFEFVSQNIRQNYVQAKHYLKLSAEEGHIKAKEHLDRFIIKDRVDLYFENRKRKRENEELKEEVKRLRFDLDTYLEAKEDWNKRCDEQEKNEG